MKSFTPSKTELIKRTQLITEHLSSNGLNIDATENNTSLINEVTGFLKNKPGCRIYLYGYHNFSNTGDQALWLSLSLILKSIQEGSKTKLLDNSVVKLPSSSSEDNILIFPGGGSLGNRYQSSKNRILLIESNPNTSFIQMPVSTSFANNDIWLNKLQAAYALNDSITFCRDIRSTKEAEDIIKIKTKTVPDLVEYLPSCASFKTAEFGDLNLIRSDQEATEKNIIFKKEHKNTFDWGDLERLYPLWSISKNIYIWKFLSDNKLSLFFKNNDDIKVTRFEAAYKISLLKTARALAFLSFYDEITTDRLHGVILSKNLGLKISYFDNDHGKIKRYISTWSRKYNDLICLD